MNNIKRQRNHSDVAFVNKSKDPDDTYERDTKLTIIGLLCVPWNCNQR